jgi:thioredoxin-related protein
MTRMTKIVALMFLWMSVATTVAHAQVKWYTIEEAEVLARKAPRKIFIKVYTNWCGWCKEMDKTSFADPNISKYLNENFYPVLLNAEKKENITFNGKTYKYVTDPNGSYNELAAYFLKNQMVYPTLVFLDENFNLIQGISGYRKPAQFEMIMTYFGENYHKSTPWAKYEKTYKPLSFK